MYSNQWGIAASFTSSSPEEIMRKIGRKILCGNEVEAVGNDGWEWFVT